MYEYYGFYVSDFDYSRNTDSYRMARSWTISVSAKLMMINLVVSELLSIFAMLFEHRIFEHRISEQKCDISPILRQ